MNTRELTFPSNKLRDIRRHYQTILAELYPPTEINAIFTLLCEEYLGWNTAQMLMHMDEPINQSDMLRFHWAMVDLKKERPIQHIIGHTDFCNCHIDVNEHVLVPRPETEEIVNHLITRCQPKTILDLCTGSGCIAIALKRAFPLAQVIGLDISSEALSMAEANARKNNVEVQFIQQDLLAGKLQLPIEHFDLIVSNPPYVCLHEKQNMQRNVLDYDPHLALFVSDEDPLVFYRTIGEYASQHLTIEGILAFEINENLGQDTQLQLQEMGFETQLRQDYRGKDRLVIANKSK